ncbi:ribosome-recycling factor, mitochondrial [Tribolium madens]|uniref:ribosome-recycling factor, mitochondrial n=1 Tax=Tribolium madens TaxID=41895 RepID=UPI001CF751F6|nr:ribosome-recycling factor, mitochondrial [Tribolium madens]
MFTLRVLFRHMNCVTMNRNCVTSSQNLQSYIRQMSPLSTFSQDRINKEHSPALTFVRNYAKGKDRKKEKGKAKVQVNESQLSEIVNVESLKTQMQKAVDLLKDDYMKHLSVRTTTGSVESIPVELDGKTHTLQELAQIVRKNPKTLVVNMSVFPQAIPAALKAIERSGMNLNPQQDGTTLFIPIPKVTTEHRENLAKSAKTLFIKCRDGIRDVQNKQVKSLKKKDKIADDMARNSEQQIIAIADGFIAEAEKILESKQKELIGKN